MVERLEVGETYIYPNCPEYKYKCLGFLENGNPIFHVTGKGNDVIHTFRQDASLYIKYVPLKTGKFWVNIYNEGRGLLWDSKELADRNNNHNSGKRIACVEVNWTEGQGL